MWKGKSAPLARSNRSSGSPTNCRSTRPALAAVLTLVEDPAATEIAPECMARGIVIAQHYSSEALRLFQGAKIDRDLRLAAQLLDWLVSWGDPNVSLPDLSVRPQCDQGPEDGSPHRADTRNAWEFGEIDR